MKGPHICCALLIGGLLWSSLDATSFADDWPQWRGPGGDGVWREAGIVKSFASQTLTPRWSVPISSGYSGPTVADGRVYVTDRVEEPQQIERVHCFDWKDGKAIWSHSYPCTYQGVGYDAGPRASVLIHEGKAYSLGAMGHLHCFDAATGKVLWEKDLNSLYKIRMPIWGISASPIVEGDLLIVEVGGEGDACFVGFDKVSGQERWRALPDRANYSTPIVIDQAGQRVLVAWTGDRIVGLAPASGKLLWEYPFPPKNMPLGVASPVLHRDLLFFSGFYDGSLLLRLATDRPAVEKVWQRRGPNEITTDALQGIISTPYIQDDHIYGVDSYGQLRCLDLKTGDRVWESTAAVPKNRWATIHFVRHEEEVWMFNDQGELIISRLSPKGFEEISRTKLISPTKRQLPRGEGVCWSHPAFAYEHVFARNDRELLCADLSQE